MPWLLIALIGVPLLEVYLLIAVGSRIGAGATIAIIVATAVVGAGLLRVQGWSTLARARQRLDAGELPAEELIEGALLAVAAALLLTPGFATDALGALVLLPRLRRALARHVLARLAQHQPPGGPPGGAGPRTVEAEYWEVEPRRPPLEHGE